MSGEVLERILLRWPWFFFLEYNAFRPDRANRPLLSVNRCSRFTRPFLEYALSTLALSQRPGGLLLLREWRLRVCRGCLVVLVF